jgi:hypothetical protein
VTGDLPEIPDGPLDVEPRPLYLDRADSIAVLTRELEAAGVTLGAYDRQIIAWLAEGEGSAVVTVGAWVKRAAQREAP